MKNWLKTWLTADAKTISPTLHDDGGMVVRARDVELPIWDRLEQAPHGDAHRIYMHKDRRALSGLTAIVDTVKPKRIVEIGVYEGGSTIYWAERYGVERLVAFEIAPQAPRLVQYIERHGLADSMRIHFGTSQDDAPALRDAMTQDFSSGAVDFVIDDASHMHRETRATVEILLPFVRPGGLYVIEDWAWAHEKDWPAGMWVDLPLLSPLLSELMLICGGGRGVIDRLEIEPGFVVLWRGSTELPRDGCFRLADHYVARDFPVVVPPRG
jgi:predicted O-methyltransferase YrrM